MSRSRCEEFLQSNWGVNRWLVVAGVALIVVAGLAFGYGYRQQILASHLTAQQSMANATINEMQGQVNTLTAKLNEMSAAQQAAAEAAAQQKASAGRAGTAGAKSASGKTTPGRQQNQKHPARLEEQQKQLKDT